MWSKNNELDKSSWRAAWFQAWTSSATGTGTKIERDALWQIVNENIAVGK